MKISQLEAVSAMSLLPENVDKARVYLEERGLRVFPNVGYIPFFKEGHVTVVDSLAISCYSPTGDLILIDTRPLSGGKNSYRKLVSDDVYHVPAYNINDIEDWRIVTEGVLNAECINQIGSIAVPTSATLTASFNNRVMHYLAASVHKGLLFAMDADAAGVKAAERVLEFYHEFYPNLTVSVLDFPYGDLNDFLQKKGRRVFDKHILNQIRLETM